MKTIGEVLDNYLTHCPGRKGIRQTQVRVARLKEWFPDSFDPAMAEIIRRYRINRIDRGAKPATINREIETLRAAFNMAEHTFPKIAPLRENNVRQGFFEEHEWMKMHVYMPTWLWLFCSFAYWTGWRKSEISDLTWDNIKNNEIRIPDSKNGRPRVIPISGRVKDVITAAADRKLPNVPWVFPNPKGKRIVDFRGPWARACKKAGLENRLFHDFRRTAARNMIARGVDRQVAKAITGHVTDSMFDRYNIVDTRQMSAALERL